MLSFLNRRMTVRNREREAPRNAPAAAPINAGHNMQPPAAVIDATNAPNAIKEELPTVLRSWVDELNNGTMSLNVFDKLHDLVPDLNRLWETTRDVVRAVEEQRSLGGGEMRGSRTEEARGNERSRSSTPLGKTIKVENEEVLRAGPSTATCVTHVPTVRGAHARRGKP